MRKLFIFKIFSRPHSNIFSDLWWWSWIFPILVYGLWNHGLDSNLNHAGFLCHNLVQIETFCQSISILVFAIQSCQIQKKDNSYAFVTFPFRIGLLGTLAILFSFWLSCLEIQTGWNPQRKCNFKALKIGSRNRKNLKWPKMISKINFRNLKLKSYEEYLICRTSFVL